MPPDWAMAMASRLSVTVSMAALTMGMFERDAARQPVETSTGSG
jgi:hypothetical protein